MAKTTSDKPVEPLANAPEPQNAEEYTARGWRHYGKREFYRAEADFRKALEEKPDDIETNYALGLCMEASGRSQDAGKIYERVIQMAKAVADDKFVRAQMFARMASTHLGWVKASEASAEKK